MSDVVKSEVDHVVQGGIWDDKNISESLDWPGESGSAKTEEKGTVTHKPKTKAEQEEDLLQLCSISPEIISLLARRIESTLQKKMANPELIVERAMETRVAELDKRINKWLSEQEVKVGEYEAKHASSVKQALDKLDEQVSVLENKIDAIITNMTTYGPDEATMIHEAAQIVKERRAVEESEVASTPSVVGRMEQRVGNINEMLRAVEPYVDDTHARTVKRATDAAKPRSKFGKRLL